MANINFDPSLRPTPVDIVTHEAEKFTPIVKATDQLTLEELLGVATRTNAEMQTSTVYPTTPFLIYRPPQSSSHFFFGIDHDRTKPPTERIFCSNYPPFCDLSSTASILRSTGIEFVQPFLKNGEISIASLTVEQLTSPGQRPRYRNESPTYPGFDTHTRAAYEIAQGLTTRTRL